MENQFNIFSSREGFNVCLDHFRAVTQLVGKISKRINLADLLNELLNAKKITIQQTKSIINALLIDKYKYHYLSYNLTNTVNDFESIVKIVGKWTAMDQIVVYFHPQLGQLIINPKRIKHWEIASTLNESELVIIYSGQYGLNENKDLFKDASYDLLRVLMGDKKIKNETQYIAKESFLNKKEIEEEEETTSQPENEEDQSVGTGMRKMSPKYSVVVANELFHNGNVEAWKKIIKSYEYVYPGIEVIIYYDKERIYNIDSLFKWGKVKKGSAIMMTVKGKELHEVAKLRRYLAEGAGPQFQRFLQGTPNTILAIFGEAAKR